MSKKLKFKEDKGMYRLLLTHAEVELIATLVQHVRLSGDGDVYKDAAADLCELFGTTEDFDCYVLDTVINVGSTVDEDGHTTIEAEDAIVNSYCSGSCSGCICGD